MKRDMSIRGSSKHIRKRGEELKKEAKLIKWPYTLVKKWIHGLETEVKVYDPVKGPEGSRGVNPTSSDGWAGTTGDY